MRQYTTPTITLTVKDQKIADKDVYVSLQYSGGLLMIEDPEMTETAKDTVITVPLTQSQTSKFKNGETLALQVNWMDGESRFATDIAYLRVTENLLKEILS